MAVRVPDPRAHVSGGETPEQSKAIPTRPGHSLRILAVTNLYPHGGSSRGVFVEEQVKAVRGLGHVVDVELVVQGRRRADYLLKAAHVARRAASGEYDVVHTHFGMTAVTTRLVRAAPRVLSLYGSDINVTWKRWMTRLGTPGTAMRIYVSDRLRATAGDPDGLVIPSGVNFELFRPGDRASVRSRLGFARDDLVVLFGADPRVRVKGYDVYRDVLTEVKRKGLRVVELILAAPAQTRSDVVDKFDAADLLLFTSLEGSEGQPIVVKEAAAMGLPVVSVDVGDVAQVLNGIVPSAVVEFPSERTRAYRRELVRRLAASAADVLSVPRRSNGRELSRWFDSRVIAERVVDVYRLAMGSGR